MSLDTTFQQPGVDGISLTNVTRQLEQHEQQLAEIQRYDAPTNRDPTWAKFAAYITDQVRNKRCTSKLISMFTPTELCTAHNAIADQSKYLYVTLVNDIDTARKKPSNDKVQHEDDIHSITRKAMSISKNLQLMFTNARFVDQTGLRKWIPRPDIHNLMFQGPSDIEIEVEIMNTARPFYDVNKLKSTNDADHDIHRLVTMYYTASNMASRAMHASYAPLENRRDACAGAAASYYNDVAVELMFQYIVDKLRIGGMLPEDFFVIKSIRYALSEIKQVQRCLRFAQSMVKQMDDIVDALNTYRSVLHRDTSDVVKLYNSVYTPTSSNVDEDTIAIRNNLHNDNERTGSMFAMLELQRANAANDDATNSPKPVTDLQFTLVTASMVITVVGLIYYTVRINADYIKMQHQPTF